MNLTPTTSKRSTDPVASVLSLEIRHQVTRQKVARPLALDLGTEVCCSDVNVMLVNTRYNLRDAWRDLAYHFVDVGRSDLISCILKPSTNWSKVAYGTALKSWLTSFASPLTHCQSCTRAISAVAASSIK